MSITSLYNGAFELDYEDSKHVYHWRPTGTDEWMKATGTTSISGYVPKPALLPWGVKLCADYIARTGDTSPEGLKAAKREHTRVKEEAGTLGTAVHLWIEQYIEREHGVRSEITASSPIFGFDNCIHAFERFVRERKPTFLESEIFFLHFLKNERGEYLLDANGNRIAVAGRGDGKWLLNGKRIFDIKTSSDLYAEYVGQVAAYERANSDEHGERLGGSLLWLDKKKGDYFLLNLSQDELDEGYEMFKHSYYLKQSNERFEKLIKGAT